MLASKSTRVRKVQLAADRVMHKATLYNFPRPEPETIKICIDCNRTIKDFNSTVTVVDGPVTVWKNVYSFGLCPAAVLCVTCICSYTLESCRQQQQPPRHPRLEVA